MFTKARLFLFVHDMKIFIKVDDFNHWYTFQSEFDIFATWMQNIVLNPNADNIS